jgi:hypothetical protein
MHINFGNFIIFSLLPCWLCGRRFAEMVELRDKHASTPAPDTRENQLIGRPSLSSVITPSKPAVQWIDPVCRRIAAVFHRRWILRDAILVGGDSALTIVVAVAVRNHDVGMPARSLIAAAERKSVN